MSEAVESIKSQARLLSPNERVHLVEFLLNFMESDEQAWRLEITRRINDIRGGNVVGRDLDTALAELRGRN